jgi:hypothetical protein
LRKALLADADRSRSRIEQILMVAIQWFTLKILVHGISLSHSGACQDIFNPPVETRLLLCGRMKRMLNGVEDGADARMIGFGIALG